VASVVSVLTLFLLVDPFRYVLFFFEIMVTICLFVYLEYSASEHDKTQKQFTIGKRLSYSLLFDWLLVVTSLFLIFSGILNMQENPLLLILTLIMTSFGSGYCLLNLSKVTSYFSKLELLVLSFIISILVSGLLFFIGIWIPAIRMYLFFSIFLLLSLFSAIKNRIAPNKESHRQSFSQRKDLLLLALAVGFYVILFLFLFPKYATIPTDATQFYRLSVMLPRTPSLFYSMNYVLFVLFQSSVLSISKAGLVSSQIAFGFLPIILIPTFYIMAKEYLESVDKKLPSLSTLFWVLFAFGLFGWVYYAQLQLTQTGQSPFDSLSVTGSYTYYSTMYGIIGYTFVAFTVAFIALLAALFLLKRLEIPRLTFCGLFALLMVTMFLSHISEAVVLAIFLVVWRLIKSNKNSLRVDDAINSSLIAFISVIIFYLIASSVFVVFWSTSMILSLALPTALLSGAIVYRKLKPEINFSIKNVLLSRKFKIAVLFLFIYILSSVTCLFSLGTFNIGQLGGIWAVPWFVYPLVLGFNGLLAIIASIFISKNEKLFSNFAFIIFFLFYCLLFARIVSFINLNFFETGYWESRFIYYMEISLALMAPIPFIKLFSALHNRIRKPTLRLLLTVLVIGLIVEGGSLTTFMNVEYWSLRSSANQPNANEIKALSVYHEIFNSDPYSCSGTITEQSLENTELAAPTDMLPLSDQTVIGSSATPENVLRVLGNPRLTHFYLYMDNRDVSAITANGWTKKYLADHLLPMLPTVFQNSEVTIYNMSKISPPLPISDQILVLPFNANSSVGPNQLFCYDLLSKGLYNYTTAFDIDNEIMKANSILLSYDPKNMTQTRSIQDYINYVGSGRNLIILNSDGSGIFAKMLFKPLTSALDSANIIGMQENITLPNSVKVTNLQPKNGSEQILSSYVSNNINIPFITEIRIGTGKLFYVNIEPLVTYLNQAGSNKSQIYNISGELLKGIGLKTYGFTPLSLSGYASEIQMNGLVSINTTSLVYQSANSDGIEKMIVTGATGISSFSNVSSIQISNVQFTIESSQSIIKDGKGFYSQLSFTNGSTLDFTPHAQVTIKANGSKYEISDVSEVSITTKNAFVILARVPAIKADGGMFKEEYSLQGISGDLSVTGGVSFTVESSDSYSLLTDFNVYGSYTNPSQNYYNELQSIPLGVIMASIIVVIIISLYSTASLTRRYINRQKTRKR
jgi:hypothetical protein